jgi:DNA primase
LSDIKFIPPDIRDQLLAKADLLDIIRHFHPGMVKAGSGFKDKCPSCGSDKFSINTAKGIIKCFKCELGAGDVINYLREFRGMKYVDACKWLADHLNFDIPTVDQLPAASVPTPATAVTRQAHDSSFRDEQLQASGITEEAQQCIIKIDDKETTINRYSAGSVDTKFLPVAGHDMLIHYYDLDGQTIMYTPRHGKTEKPYIRVRHKHPAAHPDQDGKPIRYMSPPGSKNHLWIPEHIRRIFQDREHIETLVFVEGEKKADALCMVGIHAVGIAGIYNFAKDNEMPALIERLITTCSVVNVMFWFDSDIDDLGSDISKDTDRRPRTFAKAALKFRAYFYKFQQEHINIQMWICHGIDRQHKGADDLLIALSPDLTPAHPLSQDFTAALRHPMSEGQHVRLHQITSASDTQIYEIWHLHAPSAFMRHHHEQLKALPEFRINKHRYRWDETEARFVSVQKILSHEQYWFTQDTKFGQIIKFDYLNITHFLQARGYWRQRTGLGKFRLINVQNSIIRETCPEDIQSYVYDFTAQIEETKVLRMLMQGGSQYFGPDKLKNLKVFEPPFIKPTREEEILCFKDCFWKITSKAITVHKYVELPGAVWANDVIDFSPTYIKDFFTITEKKDSPIPFIVESKIEDCDMLKYIQLTSDIHWRDARKTPSTWPEKSDPMEEKDIIRLNTMMTCMMDKIIATGYCASSFLDTASMKAIVCMDAQESKGGKSEGGTGKSLWARQFELLFPIHKINGKQARLTEDQFLYDGVDERTRMILVDDCRRTTDFEAFFSFITGGVIANSKGVSKQAVGHKRWVFTTNFSIRGEDRSHVRRQYIIAFSDYFNTERDPVSIFGHSLFEEWDDKQMNYYCNWIAHCIQFHMQRGLKTFAPDADIKRRKLRDAIGEIWLDFLETYFFTGSDYINRRFEIENLLEAFARKNPSQKQFAIKTMFKDKADMFCRYAGFNYNIPAVSGKDGRIRNAGQGLEYFCISNHEFDLKKYSDDISTAHFDSNHLPKF